ncbi:MAG: M28 family peptidase [Proteobacteria bacterium]|nr:M28 family peptidase [Pseudomonadota bacterium]
MERRKQFCTERRLAAFVIALFASSCGLRCGEGRVPEREIVPVPERIPAPPAISCVDGARALRDVERLVALGPRPPGGPGAEAARQLILGELRRAGLEPRRRDFTAHTPHPELGKVELANITADVAGPGGTVIVGGHYDLKLLPGVEFVGANDGGSSTAVLLEIARCLAARGSPARVRLAFFDGEEALVSWSDADGLYGSKRMAADLAGSPDRASVAAMVNVDMVGDRDLSFFRETLSTQWVLSALERSAERLGHAALFGGPRAAVEDDHLPFLRIGVPAADLIDLEYGPGPGSNDYWHTAADTPDKLSAASLAAAARIVIGALEELSGGEPAAPSP